MTKGDVMQISLYFKEGSSDKVYTLSIEPVGSGFAVIAQYGRRGGAMAVDTKTKGGPVDAAAAQRLFDKTVREKLAKGYVAGPPAHLVAADGARNTLVAGASPTASVPPASAATTADVAPQLLTPLDQAAAARLVADDAFWLQRKYDGKRLVLRGTKGRVIAFNRKGLPCPIAAPVAAAAQQLADVADFTIDGEEVQEHLFVFDILALNGASSRALPYSERLQALTALIDAIDQPDPAIIVVPTARTDAEKLAMLEALTAAHAEGFVLKRHAAPYAAGRHESQYKVKFWASASVLVLGPNGSKQSLAIALLDDQGAPVPVGHVTMPTKRPDGALIKLAQDFPTGTVIECRYLYAYRGGSLYQTVFLGIRDDVDPRDCTFAQLKYKEDFTVHAGPAPANQ
jgi:bifunctional non-homologous end joining protein LigD